MISAWAARAAAVAALKQALGQGMDLGLPEALDLEGRAAARLASQTRDQIHETK